MRVASSVCASTQTSFEKATGEGLQECSGFGTKCREASGAEMRVASSVCASTQISFEKATGEGRLECVGLEQNIEQQSEQRCELHHQLRICTDKFQKSYW
jgi:hypothetical protein